MMVGTGMGIWGWPTLAPAPLTGPATTTYYDPVEGVVIEKFDPVTREWYRPDSSLGQSKNVPLPPGFTPQPFDCPAGSDFAASQEVGMCVGADYTPIGIRATPGANTVYYDLTGAVAGVEPPKAVSKDWLPGVPNFVVVGALGLLLLMRARR
jgi:hypothetical protein